MSKSLRKTREKPMTFLARHSVSEDCAAMSASVNNCLGDQTMSRRGWYSVTLDSVLKL